MAFLVLPYDLDFHKNDTITLTTVRTFFLSRFRQPKDSLDFLRIKTSIINKISKHQTSFRLYMQRYMMEYIICHLRNSIRKVPYIWVFGNWEFFPKNDLLINETKWKRLRIKSKRSQSSLNTFSDHGIVYKGAKWIVSFESAKFKFLALWFADWIVSTLKNDTNVSVIIILVSTNTFSSLLIVAED